jgi:hypothetical protein
MALLVMVQARLIMGITPFVLTVCVAVWWYRACRDYRAEVKDAQSELGLRASPWRWLRAIASQQRSHERSSWRRRLLQQGRSRTSSGTFISPSRSARKRCRALAERGVYFYAPLLCATQPFDLFCLLSKPRNLHACSTTPACNFRLSLKLPRR